MIHHDGSLDDLIDKLEAEGICETGLPASATDALTAFGPKVLTLGLVVAIIPTGVRRWLG